MEEESSPYCHKFSRSQSIRLPVDCLKTPAGILLLLLGWSREDWLSGSDRSGFVNLSGISSHVARCGRERYRVFAWLNSDTSGHTLDAWLRWIHESKLRITLIVVIRLDQR